MKVNDLTKKRSIVSEKCHGAIVGENSNSIS